MTTRRQFLIGSVASAAAVALPVPVAELADYDLMMTLLSSWPFNCRCTLIGGERYEELRALDVVRADGLIAVGDKVFGRLDP